MGADLGALGMAVGHASDQVGATGVTIVRGIEGPFRAGAAVLGRATGTRELDALSPRHLVDRVDAIVLTGGSAFGLDTAGGVMRWMEERGRGFPVGVSVVPIVPAAVVFDLAPCGSPTARPTQAMAYEACERARSSEVEEGSVGAGTGTTVGKAAGPERAMKGGIGLAVETAGALHIGALAVVNALGDVRDAAGRIIAGARTDGGGFVDLSRSLVMGTLPPSARFGATVLHNTTLAVVMTNAALSREELAQLAAASSVALGRRITPVGTSYDGDVVFATGPLRGVQAPMLQVEAMAVAALEAAIERAVRLARGRDGIPGLADGRLT
ncbi:MAG TPA: P1 family peptidase [Gemmatimonadaceae bacterium]|nr:P1 family peptidase [Gemmatimonadaceae bacterium]